MIKIDTCPQKDSLVDFLLGKLPYHERESLEQHLSDCSPCVDTIRSLELNDTLDGLTRDAAVGFEASHRDVASVNDSVVIANLIRQLEKLPNSASSLTERKIQHPARRSTKEDRAAEVQTLLDPPLNPDELGLLGRYRIIRLLGAGSSGVVYLAIDQQLKRHVALKILRPSLGGDARERFLAEAQATAKLDHENIVAIYDVGIEGPLAYLAMQWVPGQTLEQRLSDGSRLPPEETLRLGAGVAAGLSAAHAQGLIHRDIKPANIWIPENGSPVRILDFGLVRITDENPQLTCTGMIAGTPCYMSPEQSRGETLDSRSDLFSLGCVLYQCLTGDLPFHCENALATLQAIQRQHPTHPCAIDPTIDPSVGNLVLMLLEKSRHRRPESASEVSQSLSMPPEDWKLEIPSYPIDQISELKPNQNSASQTTAGLGSNWIRWIIATVAIGMLAWGGIAFGPDVIRIVTNHGVIVIDSKVDDVEIEVLQNGQRVRVIDSKTKQSVDLVAGQYTLRPLGDQNSITLNKNQLTLKRGEKILVTVTQLPQENLTPLVNPRLATESNFNASRIRAGDTLTVYIEGVLGEENRQPILQTPEGPTFGYPIPVDEKGLIHLPFTQPIQVGGMTLSEARQTVSDAFQKGDQPILRQGAYVNVSMAQRGPSEGMPETGFQIQKGDTLAIYIPLCLGPGLGGSEKLPLFETPQGPFLGFPISVDEKGMIDLPLINSISTAGSTASELRTKLFDAYTAGDAPILRSETCFIHVALANPRSQAKGNPVEGESSNWSLNQRNSQQPSLDPSTSLSPSTGSSDLKEPLKFRDRTLDQWLTVIRYERDIKLLTEALQAITVLGEPENRDDLIPQVLTLFRNAPRGQNGSDSDFLYAKRRFLRSLRVADQLATIRCEFKNGTGDSLKHLLSFYTNVNHNPLTLSSASNDKIDEVVELDATIKALNTPTENKERRQAALYGIVTLGALRNTPLDQNLLEQVKNEIELSPDDTEFHRCIKNFFDTNDPGWFVRQVAKSIASEDVRDVAFMQYSKSRVSRRYELRIQRFEEGRLVSGTFSGFAAASLPSLSSKERKIIGAGCIQFWKRWRAEHLKSANPYWVATLDWRMTNLCKEVLADDEPVLEVIALMADNRLKEPRLSDYGDDLFAGGELAEDYPDEAYRNIIEVLERGFSAEADR